MSRKKTAGEIEDAATRKKLNLYSDILLSIFRGYYKEGVREFEFERAEIESAATALKVRPPKNVGDLLYSFRFRSDLPDEIANTAELGFEWVISLAGRSKYRMAMKMISRILPSPNHFEIKIPDSTPEIVSRYALGDEQALLAKVRYNRMIDIFLRVTAYSLQNHLRTTVPNIGQMETDELYVAVRNTGQQFVIPVQAKGGSDKIGAVQVHQDLALCRHAFAGLTPRPIAVQFKKDERGEAIVMFELIDSGEEIRVVDEKHYRLVPSAEITPRDLEIMARSSD